MKWKVRVKGELDSKYKYQDRHLCRLKAFRSASWDKGIQPAVIA